MRDLRPGVAPLANRFALARREILGGLEAIFAIITIANGKNELFPQPRRSALRALASLADAHSTGIDLGPGCAIPPLLERLIKRAHLLVGSEDLHLKLTHPVPGRFYTGESLAR